MSCCHRPCVHQVPQHVTAVHCSSALHYCYTLHTCTTEVAQDTLSNCLLRRNACHELLYLTEVIEDSHSLELLHLAVQAPQWHSRPQLFESLIHELHLLTCGEEHNDLGAQVRLNEGPQHIHLLVQLTNDVSLQHSTESVLSTAHQEAETTS